MSYDEKMIIKKIGVYPNLRKERVKKELVGILNMVRENGLIPFLPENIAEFYGCESYIPGDEKSLETIDAFMSLGGDGTLLRMAELLARVDVPGFGVNFGRLGFLAEVEYDDLASALRILSHGFYTVENRAMISAKVFKNKKETLCANALNDVVVSKGKISKMAHYLLRINGKQSAYMAADGIIVATATGSTAYSLSAGGPLVSPNLDVMVITPICPHALANRPLVIPLTEVVEIETDRDGEKLLLEADGRIVGPIDDDNVVVIEQSPYTMQLLRLSAQSYYDNWQEKLMR